LTATASLAAAATTRVPLELGDIQLAGHAADGCSVQIWVDDDDAVRGEVIDVNDGIPRVRLGITHSGSEDGPCSLAFYARPPCLR